MNLFEELKRRNVIKVAAAYLIVAWLLLQVSDTLVPALHLPEWFHSGVAFVLIIGFPIAMLFAWAFEITPDGLKKEKDVDRTRSMTQVTGQKLNYTIIVLLLASLTYIAWDKFSDQPPDAEDSSVGLTESEVIPANEFHSIAVLPFVNMSADAGNEYFSDGLTEELLNILAKIKELRVAGRTSSFAFKGKGEDLRSIGQKLNVSSILEGSVRKAGNRVRITAQLINVDDGYHLWSESYDRELDDIFAIQEEIAIKVARALRITLLGEDVARLQLVASTPISAYELYLKGLQGINEGSFASLDKAVNQLQQALVLDPNYTPARLSLVNAWSELANTGAISRQEALGRGLPLLESVLGEQPDNSNARIQMALFRVYQADFEAAANEFIAALDADPRNARGLQEYGRFLFDTGQIEQGMALIDAAVEIEPFAIRVVWDQCQTNAFLQNLDISLAACARIREIAPESPLGWYGWALAHMFSGDLARGAKGYSNAIERDPDDYEMLSAMCNLWGYLGDMERASEWLQRAEAIGAGEPVPTWARLWFYQFREQHDLARELAGQALAKKMENRFGSHSLFRRVWAFESMRDGDVKAALAPYLDAFPWAFQTPLELPRELMDLSTDIIHIAALLKLADPVSERPEQLLTVVEGVVSQTNPREGAWSPFLAHAAIATIRGDHETALEYLNSAWDKKWRLGWRSILIHDVIFSQLKNESGYQELVARFEADMDRQREVAYELLGPNK